MSVDTDRYAGALFVREVDDKVLVVYRMIYNDRLCVGPVGSPLYDRGFCYPQDGSAIEAAEVWDGQGWPPGPVIKEAGT